MCQKTPNLGAISGTDLMRHAICAVIVHVLGASVHWQTHDWSYFADLVQ